MANAVSYADVLDVSCWQNRRLLYLIERLRSFCCKTDRLGEWSEN